ncbi:MAG: P22 coat protein, partial [Clostridia bacterium]|nr:P22 coat protein [Clostridia bacterium]
QAVKNHVKGTLASSGTTKIIIKADVTEAEKVVLAASASGTLSGTVVKGDILTINNKTYVVTTAAEASNNEIEVKVYPAISAKANDIVTVLDSHTANLAFNPSAFAFVTRPLNAPSGVECYVTSYNGITLRVVRGYDMKYKKDMLSMDVLYGYKTVYPEMATRVLG